MSGIPRSPFRPSAALFAMVVASALAPSTARADFFAGFILQPPDGGIIVIGGDPIYNFMFDAYLSPGYQLIGGLDYLTIFDVPGTTAASLTSQPQSAPFVPPGMRWLPSPSLTPGSTTWPGSAGETVPTTDFEFDYVHQPSSPNPNTPLVNNTGSDLYLGRFTIQTLDLSALPQNTAITLEYMIHAHDLSGAEGTTRGTVTLTIVPEPASVVMLGLGVGAVGWAVRRRRRVAAAA